jgi:hypothetical protein
MKLAGCSDHVSSCGLCVGALGATAQWLAAFPSSQLAAHSRAVGEAGAITTGLRLQGILAAPAPNDRGAAISASPVSCGSRCTDMTMHGASMPSYTSTMHGASMTSYTSMIAWCIDAIVHKHDAWCIVHTHMPDRACFAPA